jgi:diguanylate cyclase (GGDEF)-like protein
MPLRAKGRLAVRTALCLLVCVLAGGHRSGQERAASFHDIMVADVNPATHGQRVHDTATVTYSDPEWRLLFVQDGAEGVYLTPPATPVLSAGNRIRIRGITTEASRLLDHTEISVLAKDAPMPPAVPIANASDLAKFPSRWVEIQGTVRWSGIRYGRATLEVFAGDRLFRALVFPGTSEDLPRIGSEIKIEGVSAPQSDKGEVGTLQILAPSARRIQILQAGPEDPFSLPRTDFLELKKVRPGSLVHLAGRAVERGEGLVLEDRSRALAVNFDRPIHGNFAAADVAGFWTGHSLDDATIRPIGGLSPEKSDVTTLFQLKHLTVAQAALQQHVRVEGVVTYWDPDWYLLFVQDPTAAAFIATKAPNLGFRVGDVVDVSGTTNPGDFAPTVANATVSFVRRGSFPQPLHLDLVQSNLADADSSWSNFRGVVHTAQARDGHTILKLGAGPSALRVELPTLIKAEELIDKEISVTGVLGILFNERRQAIGHQIFVPSAEFLTVINHGGKPNPPTAIIALRRYSPEFDEHHRVHIHGTVVFKGPEQTIFVEDQTAGIQVRIVRSTEIADGDQVSVEGFLLPGEYSPALEDAVVERMGAGEMPQPEEISAKAASEGTHDSEYVSMRSTFSGMRSSRNGSVLVLNDGSASFDAIGPVSNQLAAMRVGSLLEVRGICRATLDRSGVPYTIRGFTLMFDSPASVSVLRPGPWWDARRVRWAFLLIALIAGAIALWATVLQRQVQAKTGELQLSLEAKRKAQLFDIARNEVLESIARNAPLPESMERLVLAIEEQLPGGTGAIVLPHDGRTFLNGKPAPVLIAPGVPEELYHHMLPVLASILLPAEGSLHVGQNGHDPDLLASLVDILREPGKLVATGDITIVFSASGMAEGLIILFQQPAPAGNVDSAQPAVLDSASRLVSLARDHWLMHERLVHEARHDGLTGLPNRTVAEDRLEQALARAERRRKLFAVFCIDLDGFKAINDELGHEAGDDLLRVMSTRLKSRVRHSDTLARMGGDEFMAVIEDCTGDAAAQAVAHSLLSTLQEPVVLDHRQLKISGSIGVAMYPADGINASQLKRHADQAMYRAKSRGGSQVSFWSAEATGTGKVAQQSSGQD